MIVELIHQSTIEAGAMDSGLAALRRPGMTGAKK
jgi:hypothetical protein